jgi:hypothetical protein
MTLNTNGGVLLYAGKLGGKDITLSGTTTYVSISMTRDPFYAANTTHVQATMDAAGLTWETGVPVLPVDPEALLELARKHRAEYEDLREKLAILRALGG